MLRPFVFSYLILALIPFYPQAQNRYDVIISEFLPDPTPAIGLPQSEFIELKNRSAVDYNLHNWSISNGNSSASIKTDYILKADSFLILCANSAATEYNALGPTLGIASFPSIDNDAGDLIVSADSGRVIHAVHYDKSYFENDVKAAGGWSLEMIDMSHPWTGKTNWTASRASAGGTPGHKNSVDAINPDEAVPSLIRATTPDSLDILLFFDEPIDSLSASQTANYMLTDGLNNPQTAAAMAPFFNQVLIHLTKDMQPGKIYTVSVQNIHDCSGNEIGLHNSCKAGLPEKVKSNDIIFNEILFNPPPYGYDYLELYNRSSGIVNCAELYIAGKDATGMLKDPAAIVDGDRLFFPGEYLLLSENADWVTNNYPPANPAQILSLPALPSMPDDAGEIVLLNASGVSIDELDYDHHWHSPLLVNESGVALERVQTEAPSIASNWTSAAAATGYGTPTYKNSEAFTDSAGNDLISLNPKIFSPDQDGYQDFCFINYKLPAAGFIGSISVYDVSGRMVRKLVNNIIWGNSGSFRWDGLDDNLNELPVGHYIIYASVFRTDGTVINKKLVCTLARK